MRRATDDPPPPTCDHAGRPLVRRRQRTPGGRVMNSRNPAAGPATSHRGTALLDRATRVLRDPALDATRSGGNPLGVPLDRHREGYHYNHLFRDRLGAELERREPELIQHLQARAAAWCEANGLPE